jgi:hypothetical protein
MTAWTALLKKELRLGSLAFFIFFGFELGLMAIGLIINFRFQSAPQHAAVFAIGVLLIGAHYLYLLSYLFVNIFTERKTFQLWLHNPLPGWSMLAAKLLSGLIYLTASLLAAGIYTLAGFSLLNSTAHLDHYIHVGRVATLIAGSIYWISLYNGIALIFVWFVLRFFLSRVSKWAWLILLAGIAAFIYVVTKLTQWGVFDFITNWGQLPDSFSRYWIFTAHVPDGAGAAGPFYIGNLVFDLVIMAILFTFSSWLMDRRLEVS